MCDTLTGLCACYSEPVKGYWSSYAPPAPSPSLPYPIPNPRNGVIVVLIPVFRAFVGGLSVLYMVCLSSLGRSLARTVKITVDALWGTVHIFAKKKGVRLPQRDYVKGFWSS